MRADLHTMEQIDLYLQGKLSGEELHQFENMLSSNPDLQSMVSDQQLLIQTVSRKALLAEIHAVAGIGGAPWYANPFVAVTGAALVIGGIATTIYVMSGDPETENTLAANQETIAAVPQTAETNSSSKQTLYMYGDSISGNERFAASPEHYADHESTGGQEPDHTTNTHEYIQADHLSHQADDNADDVSDYENRHPDESYSSKNRLAAFPKGEMALKEFIKENMRFPGTAREKKLSGNVKVKFLVTSEGTRTNIEANCFNLRDENDKPLTSAQMMLNQKIANLFEREAERIVRIMPTWIPATDSQGNPVLTTAELYFNFSLKDGNSVYRFD